MPGLSKTGVEAVENMNELGILVDLSHCGRQTAADAIKASKRPVAFTHTGSAALNDHPRNRTDAELRAVAEKGGVSGIYFMPFLSEGKQPTAADVIRHLEHMIDVAGEDHVSIGTDGGISAEVVDAAFKERFAGFRPQAPRRGHLGAGRDRGRLPVRQRAQYAAPVRDARGHALRPRPRRRAHRKDPRQEPGPRLLRHLEVLKGTVTFKGDRPL